MIDDKKVKETCDKALKNSVFNDNVHAYPYVTHAQGNNAQTIKM